MTKFTVKYPERTLTCNRCGWSRSVVHPQAEISGSASVLAMAQEHEYFECQELPASAICCNRCGAKTTASNFYSEKWHFCLSCQSELSANNERGYTLWTKEHR